MDIKKEEKKKKIKTIIVWLLFYASLIIFFSGLWGVSYFQIQSLEQIIFHIKVPMEGSNIGDFFNWCITVILRSTIIFLVVFFAVRWLKKKKLCSNIVDVFQRFSLKIVSLFLVVTLVTLIFIYDVPGYIYNQFQTSNIFEKYYVNAKEVDFTFPQKKRNLIYIFLESTEVTFSTSNQIQVDEGEWIQTMDGNGFEEKNYIPYLSQAALENYSFSNKSGLGGAFQAPNTGWTIAGMVSQTAGIPLTLPINGARYVETSEEFLPGVYSLGEILEANGYNQMLMVGSDASFGGRQMYFEQHGDYEIYDLFTAQGNGDVPKDYKTWWGIEDDKLFNFAQREISELAKQEEPFNFTMLTADTHHPEGYPQSCGLDSEASFMEVYECSDYRVKEFIDWAKEQPWYENTTIILSGDHLSMNTTYMSQVDEYGYDRRVYNAILNPEVDSYNNVRLNNREFTTMDMFPTTLASLGVTWDGDRLGLGTNLWSKTPTLPELLGRTSFEKELKKRSKYYNDELLLYDKD